jgi:molecular chaperone DnaJ
MSMDYYLILGLASTASPEEVRAAYRRRALELHPDQSGGESKRFLDLQEAYSVLSNPDRRTAYDRQRNRTPWRLNPAAEPLRAPGRGAESFRASRHSGGRRTGPIDLWTDFSTWVPGFEELTDRWWRNFGGTRPKSEGIQALTVEVPLSRQEARWGGEVEIRVPVRAACRLCGGRGSVGYEECWRCGGAGSGVWDGAVRVAHRPGLMGDHEEWVSLEGLGVENLCMRVLFRVSEGGVTS